MSADLFAEFGGGSDSTRAQDRSQPQKPKSQAESLIPGLEVSEDAIPANPWGDVTSSAAPEPSPEPQTGYSAFTAAPKADDFRGPREQSQYDGNVLFDASLETLSNDSCEEWGEFETAEPQPMQHPTRNSTQEMHSSTTPVEGAQSHLRSHNHPEPPLLIDSLSNDDPPAKAPPLDAAFGSVEKAQNRSQPTPTKRPAEPPAEEPRDEFFDDWGDFIESSPPRSSAKENHKDKPEKRNAPERGKQERTPAPSVKPRNVAPHTLGKSHSASPAQVRPTNIPPPSVLLQVFPQLFKHLQQAATRVRRDSQPSAALEETSSLITWTLKAAARVIVGRTLRWKRDSILSQSMKIGPARSGKPGGMKLNTVNKNEDIKEQQEAIDALSMWRDRTALYNSVLQASGKRPIPVVAENARVTTASASQGGIKASHACALCGLKREERLPKIDEGVDDCFGEWWADHWGHADCKQFWESNMHLLDQR